MRLFRRKGDTDSDLSIPGWSGYVYGFRSMRYDRGDKFLRSPIREMIWRPGENRATCIQNVPGHSMKDCQCGFYAFWPGADASYTIGYTYEPVAVLRAWGRVMSHAQGFRAEHAQIVAVALNEEISSVGDMTHLAMTYHCPVELTDDPSRYGAVTAARMNREDGHSADKLLESPRMLTHEYSLVDELVDNLDNNEVRRLWRAHMNNKTEHNIPPGAGFGGF